MRILYATTLVLATAIAAVLFGCDSDITGAAFENEPPDTRLSVRDTSLVENIGSADRLSSTVFVSWSGTDRDGFVPQFEIRFYQRHERPGPEEGWAVSARNDSLVLLPIPRGERIADVVFEARAIDNQGMKDPSPARTVFPIKNAPPAIKLSIFDLPPDTTFQIFSFAWEATDPEGEENLDRIEVSLNDTLNFVSLPADVTFATFVGQLDRNQPQDVVEARIYTGRAFSGTEFRLPNLRLDADNAFYIRSVDRTDTTSTMDVHTWYVKRQKSDVLYVNDYRIPTHTTLFAFHSQLLEDYLPAGTEFDAWDITRPYVSGNVGNVPRSSSLPPAADPTLRRMLAQWKYIYWVSTNTINSTAGNNLPYVADVMDLFFENGGTLMVHSPISLPNDPEENLGNAALLLLPLTGLISFPDSLRPSLRINTGAEVDPLDPVPVLQQPMPPLVARGFLLNTLPYIAEGANTIPLYSAEYQYVTRQGNRRGPWPGPSTVASMSADRRVGLFALPLVDLQNGEQIWGGQDGDPDAARRAVMMMLESLGFPKR